MHATSAKCAGVRRQQGTEQGAGKGNGYGGEGWGREVSWPGKEQVGGVKEGLGRSRIRGGKKGVLAPQGEGRNQTKTTRRFVWKDTQRAATTESLPAGFPSQEVPARGWKGRG